MKTYDTHSTTAAVNVRHLSKHYGAHRAVDDVSFTIAHGDVVGLSRWQYVDRRILALVGLTGEADQPPRSYSLGMRQRLSIGIALVNRPELVILDEPANGLDPAGIIEIRKLLRRLPAMGATVLVSSHQPRLSRLRTARFRRTRRRSTRRPPALETPSST